MQLDDLLTLVPGMRRMRTVNADLLRILLDRKKKECTWCGKGVPPRSSTWCSQACVDAFKLRCDGQRQRDYVIHRDAGICQKCSRDTFAAEKQFGKLAHRFDIASEADKQILRAAGFARSRWREVDHVVPVVLGGGLCPIEELRCLCGTCHAEETKKLSAMRAGK